MPRVGVDEMWSRWPVKETCPRLSLRINIFGFVELLTERERSSVNIKQHFDPLFVRVPFYYQGVLISIDLIRVNRGLKKMKIIKFIQSAESVLCRFVVICCDFRISLTRNLFCNLAFKRIVCNTFFLLVVLDFLFLPLFNIQCHAIFFRFTFESFPRRPFCFLFVLNLPCRRRSYVE